MAKNNGKFTFFLILCLLVVSVILIMGVSEGNKVSKVNSFGISNKQSANGIVCTISGLSGQAKESAINVNSVKKHACNFAGTIKLNNLQYDNTQEKCLNCDENKESVSNLDFANDFSVYSENSGVMSVNDKNMVSYTNKTMSKQENSIELLCLMYHNVVADNQKQGDYEIRVSALEKDFLELKKMGYQCVDRKNLLNIIDKKRYGKYVMITFDDGFYGVYKYLPKLLEKHDMCCIVSVVGEFMDIADKQNYKTRCSYMNTKEVQELAKSQRVEIAHHSYSMHHINNDRRGVKINKNEGVDEYKNKLLNDTKCLNDRLNGIGIKTKTYCYPFGEYCKESEGVLRGLDYQMTMTCNEHINYISDRNSLYLIGRINRSAKYENLSNMLLKTCNIK